MKHFLLTVSLLLFSYTLLAQIPEGYYQKADGKKAASLKSALYSVITDHTVRTYTDLWTDFLTTDMREDGKVWDMYSDVSNFIFGKENGGNQDTGSGGNAEGQYYNREHSFPNSWFGGKKTHPAYTDLFHLYPTDKYVNNKRGNNPFGEVENPSWTSANSFCKLGKCSLEGYDGTVFEPADEYKGDFARTYFYMATAYEDEFADWASITTDGGAMMSGDDYPGYKAWALEMLLRWAKNDPVSEKEVNRNNAVFGIQNNRNPFIDYPGLEQYVWGECVSMSFSSDNYVEPGTSYIENVSSEGNSNTVVFDIYGREVKDFSNVKNLSKGIYIISGRKYLVR